MSHAVLYDSMYRVAFYGVEAQPDIFTVQSHITSSPVIATTPRVQFEIEKTTSMKWKQYEMSEEIQRDNASENVPKTRNII